MGCPIKWLIAESFAPTGAGGEEAAGRGTGQEEGFSSELLYDSALGYFTIQL